MMSQRRTRITRRVIPFACALALAVWPAAAGGQTITIETENYSSSSNLGNIDIQSYQEIGCSSGYVLYGLDYPDEWVQYGLTPTVFGTFSARIYAKGYIGFENRIRLEVTPRDGGLTQTGTFVFTGDGLFG